MMRAFNTGMAVFDGIVLGVKVMKKFRKYLEERDRISDKKEGMAITVIPSFYPI